MLVNQLLKCYSSSSSSEEDVPMKAEVVTAAKKKKLFSIKGALDLIDHAR